ncbi:hypothetical protein LD39_15420 [Halobacillus sp. BBL2006]|nr:hypothetical protein LD39_15420 [Halobacillus sp. BBL2006]
MYILPVLEDGWGRIFMGVNDAVLSFFGFIVTLVIYSKVEGKAKDKLKTIFFAHWFVWAFYLLIVFVSFTFFGTREIDLVPEPVLYMLKSYEFSIVARIDLFFICIWILSVATSYATYLYMAKLGITEIFNFSKPKLITLSIGLLTFVISLSIGFDYKRVDLFSKFVVNTGYFFSIGFPILMLIVGVIVRKFSEKEV